MTIACGKRGEEKNSTSASTSNIGESNPTDMEDLGNQFAYFYGANGASYQKSSPDDFILRTGTGANPQEGDLNGSDRLGGKAFLGFPLTASSQIRLSENSVISFFNIRMNGSSDKIQLNLIVDGNCNGKFESQTDALVVFPVEANSYFVLDKNSPIAQVGQNKMNRFAIGDTFSSLFGKCLLNTEVFDLGMPKSKTIAGAMIVVGDGNKNEFSDASFRVFDIVMDL